MNCPSRNDEDVLFHPDWNQSPPRFAADLTTREDLNGMANTREIRADGGLKDVFGCSARYIVEDPGADVSEKRRLHLGEGVEGPHQGACGVSLIHFGLARY